jgi:methionyl-tRNA formyltransferase
MKPRILFLGKAGHSQCLRAAEQAAASGTTTTTFLGTRGDRLPISAVNWCGDYIISYLAPWIVPASLLGRASRAAINFHPGPPSYPGIGCTNFAIYDGVTEFGVTCHHMAPQVDSGPIIAVRRFPLLPSDDVRALTLRCYDAIEALFEEIFPKLLAGAPLPAAEEDWTRRPFTRRELNALCRITPDMPPDEIHRRIRAVTYPGAPGAYVELAGHRFTHIPDLA